jgi:DNA replication protein DnaC
MTDVLTVTCRCGATTTRERATGGGRIAEAMNAIPFVCDSCIAADDEADRVRAEHDRERAFASRVNASGMPPALVQFEFERLDGHGLERALAAARQWASGELAGLLLTGSFGVGKTTIAAAALHAALRRGRGQWLSAPLLLARLGSGLGSQQRDQVMATLESPAALVLDDLDKTRPTEYGAEQVFLAIDTSVTIGRQLLVTTNLSLNELAEKWPEPFGDAITSRLAGYCQAINLTGPDRRLAR